MARYERLSSVGDSEHDCLIPYSTPYPSEDDLVSSSLPSLSTKTARRPSLVQRILQNSRGVWSLRATSHRSTHVKALRLLWCLALLSGEHVIYWAMIRRCSWPENEHWVKCGLTFLVRYYVVYFFFQNSLLSSPFFFCFSPHVPYALDGKLKN